MKHILLAIIVFVLVIPAFCQETSDMNKKISRQDYLRKSKGQKIAAFVLLGTGITSIALVSNGEKSFNTTGTVAVIGGIFTLSSIPFFIISGKNKRKAKAAVEL